MSNSSYGEINSPEDVKLYRDSKDGQDTVDTESSDLLWEYHKLGTLNNVKIHPGDGELAVDSDALLAAAYVLERKSRSAVFLLEPGVDNKAYSDLLDRVNKSEVLIVDESSQYDASKGGFVVWVRYDELEYRLSPRYAYLKEEQ